ncbi:MAG: uroporphyrinogen decarboxylase family protein [Anaerolineae bacterium]
MNCRDRVLAALDFEEPDILPYTLPMEDEVGRRMDARLGGPTWRKRVEDHIALVQLPTLSVREGAASYTDAFGSTWCTDKRPFHLENLALPEPDLSDYSWPEIDALWNEDLVHQQIRRAQTHGQFIVASTGFGIFERSWTLRGFENALTDMLLHRAFYAELLDGVLNIHLRIVERLLTLPIDGILLSDDWGAQRGMIMGPNLWRTFIKPRVQQFNSAVHAGGKWTFHHCCGNVFEIIPEMIESGLDVLESLQPEAMDVYEIKRRYGRDLRLWGGLGTQRLLPFGTPQEIRSEVRRLCQELGRGGGYILAPSKPLMSEVPTENALAVVEAFTATTRSPTQASAP